MLIEVSAAVIIENNSVLLCSRPENKPPKGWEFPGGKIEKNETPQEALQRELFEELKISSKIEEFIDEVNVVNSENTINIKFYFASINKNDNKTILPQEGQEFDFFSLDSPPPSDLLKADIPIWEKIKNIRIDK